MPSVHFNGPVLGAKSYSKGAYFNVPIDQVNRAEFAQTLLEFGNTSEIVVGAGGPWALGSAIGGVAAPAITAVVNSLANFDPGTAANTGQEWHLTQSMVDPHITAASPGQDFVLSARMGKNGNADTFGCLSLDNLGGIVTVLTTAGIINAAGSARAFFIAINGSGTVSAGITNGGATSSATYTDRNFGLNEFVDVAIVGLRTKFVASAWTHGSVEFYVRGKRVHTVNATGGTWTNGLMNPTVSVVNGTSTVGHTRFDYINWSATRGVIP